jgi:hypothetical protein
LYSYIHRALKEKEHAVNGPKFKKLNFKHKVSCFNNNDENTVYSIHHLLKDSDFPTDTSVETTVERCSQVSSSQFPKVSFQFYNARRP